MEFHIVLKSVGAKPKSAAAVDAQQRSTAMAQVNVSHRQFQQTVVQVDLQLRQLASQFVEHEFAHPKAGHFATEPPKGPKMKTAKELATVTDISINVHKPCGGNLGKDMQLLVLVYNRAKDLLRRQTIRKTFGSLLRVDPHAAIYFIVAKDGNQTQLEEEARQYNDIIQINYQEYYYNCTLKGIAMLRWTALHCPYAKYMLKYDDDSFVRVKKLLFDLNALGPNTHIIGKKVPHPFVLRNRSKWFISKRYWPYQRYPTYSPGLYFIPGHLTARLYEAIVKEPRVDTIPALPFDDAYITGILREKAQIPLKNGRFIKFYVKNAHTAPLNWFKSFSLFVSGFSPAALMRAWNMTQSNGL